MLLKQLGNGRALPLDAFYALPELPAILMYHIIPGMYTTGGLARMGARLCLPLALGRATMHRQPACAGGQPTQPAFYCSYLSVLETAIAATATDMPLSCLASPTRLTLSAIPVCLQLYQAHFADIPHRTRCTGSLARTGARTGALCTCQALPQRVEARQVPPQPV